MPKGFVDTNVLVYAADEMPASSRKTVIARELIRTSDLCISTQVLNEFTVNARNRKKLNLSKKLEKKWLSYWMRMEVSSLSIETFLKAIKFSEKYQVSHWDGLILASAKECGCEIVYSEDLNDRQIYNGVQVVNPFREIV